MPQLGAKVQATYHHEHDQYEVSFQNDLGAEPVVFNVSRGNEDLLIATLRLMRDADIAVDGQTLTIGQVCEVEE